MQKIQCFEWPVRPAIKLQAMYAAANRIGGPRNINPNIRNSLKVRSRYHKALNTIISNVSTQNQRPFSAHFLSKFPDIIRPLSSLSTISRCNKKTEDKILVELGRVFGGHKKWKGVRFADFRNRSCLYYTTFLSQMNDVLSLDWRSGTSLVKYRTCVRQCAIS